MDIFFILTLILSPSVYSFATHPNNTNNSIRSRRHDKKSLNVIHQMSATTSESDIAIIGCGVLGTSLCKQLLTSPDFQGRSVTGITKTNNNHQSIMDSINPNNEYDNFHLCTMDDVVSKDDKKFKNIVFCAPPSGFDDYPSAIQNVIDTLWVGGGVKEEEGNCDDSCAFIFTSSGGIYGPGDGETVSETTPLPESTSPRTKRLIEAESNVITAGGSVLRLAGLYTLERGAHNYWLEKNASGQISGSRDGIINLLHYDDAAGSCLAALKANRGDIRGKVFLISDGNPTTRGGICESALKSKRYGGMNMPSFGEEDGGTGKGKIYDGHWSNEVLAWKPSYPSFDDFMKSSQ